MSRETLESFTEVELPDVKATEFGWPAGTPTLLWNAMVNPWKGFPVKGVIWYQGEANSADPALYKKLFPAMVAEWRTFFSHPRCRSIMFRLLLGNRKAVINSTGLSSDSVSLN